MKRPGRIKGCVSLGRPRATSFLATLICAMAVGLGGCASTEDVRRLQRAHLPEPIKLLLVESPMSADPARLQKVFAGNVKAESPALADVIARASQRAQDYGQASMASAFARRPHFEVVTPALQAQPLVQGLRATSFGSAISQTDADALHAASGADALLRFEITDYGLTPVAWRSGYIAFEVTTTLALAAVIAYSSLPVAKVGAGAYLAQETVEETLEGYAGFQGLDVVCRPVRIEAELIRLQPVTPVWTSVHTGLSDIVLSRLTRTVSTAELNGQLDQSIDGAANDIVGRLANALQTIELNRQLKRE